MDRYNRNRFYVRKEEQEKVRDTRILLGGAGIGSIIAECALRFGFEDIVIVDGDKVELTYRNEPGELPPPQLSVASWIVAGHCVNAMFDIITGREVKYFPKFYFSSLRCDQA